MEQKEKTVGFWVRELNNALRSAREREEDDTIITNLTMMQRWTIGYLADNQDHDVYQRELASELNIGDSTLTELLHTMEKNNLVTRSASKHDARCKKIELTEKSRQIISIIAQKITQTEENLRNGITDEEYEIFLKTIKKMVTNISERSL